MKLLLLLLFFAIGSISFGQKFDKEIICSTDTLVVFPIVSMKQPIEHSESEEKESYKIVKCRTCTNFGYQIEIGFSKYYYGEKTYSWIGNHGGPDFGLSLFIYNINLGARFKPWTTNPKKEMIFNGQVIPTTIKFNPTKIDYYIGYSINLEKLWSVQPYFGYNRSSFEILEADEIYKNFEFDKTGGIIFGVTTNKYFKMKDYEFLSIFSSIGYGLIDFEKIHPDLDNNYFEWTIGIAYKGFAIRRFNKKIE